ncbi:hypothetical protein C8Q77DRAFT_660999 [Trametes polyzona]|nr:hypothetical protein C8Q77DRAFT_660999 [Trametes polyzona]
MRTPTVHPPRVSARTATMCSPTPASNCCDSLTGDHSSSSSSASATLCDFRPQTPPQRIDVPAPAFCSQDRRVQSPSRTSLSARPTRKGVQLVDPSRPRARCDQSRGRRAEREGRRGFGSKDFIQVPNPPPGARTRPACARRCHVPCVAQVLGPLQTWSQPPSALGVRRPGAATRNSAASRGAATERCWRARPCRSRVTRRATKIVHPRAIADVSRLPRLRGRTQTSQERSRTRGTSRSAARNNPPLAGSRRAGSSTGCRGVARVVPMPTMSRRTPRGREWSSLVLRFRGASKRTHAYSHRLANRSIRLAAPQTARYPGETLAGHTRTIARVSGSCSCACVRGTVHSCFFDMSVARRVMLEARRSSDASRASLRQAEGGSALVVCFSE